MISSRATDKSHARCHFSRAKDMSATYVALQGEDTNASKHPGPVTAPAAGHPAPVLHVIENSPRGVHRGAFHSFDTCDILFTRFPDPPRGGTRPRNPTLEALRVTHFWFPREPPHLFCRDLARSTRRSLRGVAASVFHTRGGLGKIAKTSFSPCLSLLFSLNC